MTMVIRRDSDRHERRRGRNLAVLIALIVLVGLVFAVTTVKLGPSAANPSVGKTWGTSLIEWLQGENVAPAEPGPQTDLRTGTGVETAPGAGDDGLPNDAAPSAAPVNSEPGAAGEGGENAPDDAASDLSPSAGDAMMSDESPAGNAGGAEAGAEMPGAGSDNERMPE